MIKLKPIKEMFPEVKMDDYNEYVEGIDYDDILEYFADILISVSDKDYQGDTRYLIRDREDGRIGISIIGWGSCTACDELQGCESFEELEELILHIVNSIKWFDNAKECLYYLNNHDWKGDHLWYDTSKKWTKKFIKRSKQYIYDNYCLIISMKKR